LQNVSQDTKDIYLLHIDATQENKFSNNTEKQRKN